MKVKCFCQNLEPLQMVEVDVYQRCVKCGEKPRNKPTKALEREAHVICELPPGTTIKILNGALVACHPDHPPVFIGGVNHGN